MNRNILFSVAFFLLLSLACSLVSRPSLDIGSTMISPVDGMKMVFIPDGEFNMGSDGYQPSEEPIHQVYLQAFWLDQTEVTNDQFTRFVSATGYITEPEKQGTSSVWQYGSQVANYSSGVNGANWRHPRGPESDIVDLGDHPVVAISWNDAVAYCSWAGRRLPTEAEWEKAAVGDDGQLFPWGNEQPNGNLVNFADVNLSDATGSNPDVNDGYRFTAPVGTYPGGASRYGAVDMAGNVSEWVMDWFNSYPGNTVGDSDYGEKFRVVRGGSWRANSYSIRVAKRMIGYPDHGSDNIGFRCVMNLNP